MPESPEPIGRNGEHHRADGGFQVPWRVPPPARRGGVIRWSIERVRADLPPTPGPASFRRERSLPALPRAAPGEIRLTWVGQSTYLAQIGGINLLTDPVWSHRASPFAGYGPARIAPPGLPLAALPPIDAVLLSHDHYDHLDDATVRALHRRFGAELRFVAPLGYAGWLRRRGVREVTELDWWQRVEIGTGSTRVEIVALPVQHWTRRSPVLPSKRLWCGYALLETGGARTCFIGDSGYFDGFAAIGEEFGPFDAALLPIGAYAPRWLMKPMHMDPEEAVQAYVDLGGSGTFAAMHWGTFRLSDEDLLEPPDRLRSEWQRLELRPDDLWIPAHGETRILRAAGAG